MSNQAFDEYELPPDPPATTGNGQGNGGLTIRTMNQNMGAVRVNVQRDMKLVHDRVRVAATYGGRSFEYRIPFRKKLKDERGRPVMENGQQKVVVEYVTGPTIDCTNAVAGCYGNCDVRAEIVEIRPEAYVIEATFLDVETGFRMTRPFIQDRARNIGGMGGDAGRVQEAITGIGISKALRNVVRNALGPLVEYGVEQARRSQTDRIERHRPEAEAAVTARCEEFGVPLARIEKYYGAKLADMSPRVVAQVLGLLNSVRDELIGPDEVCPEGDIAPAAGEPVPERQEGAREDAQAEAGKAPDAQDAQHGAQEPRQEPEEQQEGPKPAGKRKGASKARMAEPEAATAKEPEPKPAERVSEEPPKEGQVYWQVFAPDGKVARRMAADPEGWFLAFDDEHERTPKDQRPMFLRGNMRRLREVAESYAPAAKFLEYIEQ